MLAYEDLMAFFLEATFLGLLLFGPALGTFSGCVHGGPRDDDLVPIWTAIIALGVFLYVLLDGFDLGVGILYGFAREADRATIMSG